MLLYTRFSLSMEMSKLTRDGTAEPVSRDQFSGTNGDREILFFAVQLTTSRIGNLTRLMITLAIQVASSSCACVSLLVSASH